LTLYVWVLWRRNKITVTTRRIIERRGGIIGGEEVSIQLSNVTDIRVKTSALGSILKYGLVEVESAGSGTEIVFNGISRPHKLKEILFDLQDGVIDGGPVDRRKVEAEKAEKTEKTEK
jgi:hypothetical protein